MHTVFWNLKEIPIPPEAKVNHSDGKVAVYYHGVDNKRRRYIIGRAVNATMMHPNTNFKFRYPDLWFKYYGVGKMRSYELHAGLYGLALGIGLKTKIYPLLQNVFGVEQGNALMDYALFTFGEHAQDKSYEKCMLDQLYFSHTLLDDSSFAKLFSEEQTIQGWQEFRELWLKKYGRRKSHQVWLCLKHCVFQAPSQADGSEIATKQGTYLVAISTLDGLALTWRWYEGDVDGATIKNLKEELALSDIEVVGAMFESPFVQQETLNELSAIGMDSLVLLTRSDATFQQMHANYAKTITWNMPYMLDVEGIFGMSKEQGSACIGLFFEAKKAFTQSLAMLKEGYTAVTALHSSQQSEQSYAQLWKQEQEYKGYYALISSRLHGADKLYDLYQLRKSVDQQWALCQAQVERLCLYKESEIQNILGISFLATILRSEMLYACQRLELDFDAMYAEMKEITIINMIDNHYHGFEKHSPALKKLYAVFSITPGEFKKFAEEINIEELKPIEPQRRVIPSMHPRELPKRGRPKGRKNNKTLAREALAAEQAQEQEQVPAPRPKGQRGRPKGSKNKKTLEREAKGALKGEAALYQGAKKNGVIVDPIKVNALKAALLTLPRRRRPQYLKSKAELLALARELDLFND